MADKPSEMRSLKIIWILMILSSQLTNVVRAQQSTFDKELIRMVDQGKTTEALRKIDSAKYNINARIYHQLTFFQFALLYNNLELNRGLMKRLGKISADDFGIGAALTDKDSFPLLLSYFSGTNIDDYILMDFLNPIDNSSLDTLKHHVIIESEDGPEDPGFKFRPADTTSINLWFDRIKLISSQQKAIEVAISLALEVDVQKKEPISGANYLLGKYFYGYKGPIDNWYEKRFFKQALENNKWAIVDKLIRLGVEPQLQSVDFEKVGDADRLLGLVVKQQLVNTKSTTNSLAINRSWTMPPVHVEIPKNGNQFLNEDVLPSENFKKVFGNSFFLSGRSTMLQVSGDINLSIVSVQVVLNDTYEDIFTKWDKKYAVTIPQSDTTGWGQYHGITVVNSGTAPDGTANMISPIYVSRNGVIFDTIYSNDRRSYSRAFGPLVLSGKLQTNTFGAQVYFSHRTHNEVISGDLRKRLLIYQDMLKAKKAEIEAKDWLALAHDARTSRMLLSEQMREANMVSIVKGELRLAMKALAEQSEFTAAFSNYLYSTILDLSVPNSLSSLTGNDPIINAQVAALKQALSQRAKALELLDELNIQQYTSKLFQVENLMYELAQYCSKTELLAHLDDNLNSFTSSLRVKFRENYKSSKNMSSIKTADLDGKGQTLINFLGI